MATCSICDGEGFLTSLDPEEEQRGIMDSCYHCGETGEVDDGTDYHDRLESLAYGLASHMLAEAIRVVNSDPEGEGWDIHAAENMMSTWDYNECWVLDTVPYVMDRLNEMSVEEQAFMLAEDGNWFGASWATKKEVAQDDYNMNVNYGTSDCGIPF